MKRLTLLLIAMSAACASCGDDCVYYLRNICVQGDPMSKLELHWLIEVARIVIDGKIPDPYYSDPASIEFINDNKLQCGVGKADNSGCTWFYPDLTTRIQVLNYDCMAASALPHELYHHWMYTSHYDVYDKDGKIVGHPPEIFGAPVNQVAEYCNTDTGE